MSSRTAVLDAQGASAYLQRHGFAVTSARELGGGVSNVVLAIDVPDGPGFVLKQSLPKLRVAEDWPAKRERTITEARALEVAATLTPGAVPAVVHTDPQEFVLVIEHAPQGWTDWKSLLLRGRAAAETARRLGEVLGTWHRETEGRDELLTAFDDSEAFEQLRVDPYHRTVCRRRPELAADVERYVDAMLSTKRTLVHGDYSPKNVLLHPSQPQECWVVDFEVAHAGDPAFDVAFMLNHLMLKAIHHPEDTDAYRRCALEFHAAYAETAHPPDEAYVLGHVGCLMVARVDGKSPAEYLREPGRETARRIGSELLLRPPDRLEDAWARLEKA